MARLCYETEISSAGGNSCGSCGNLISLTKHLKLFIHADVKSNMVLFLLYFMIYSIKVA